MESAGRRACGGLLATELRTSTPGSKSLYRVNPQHLPKNPDSTQTLNHDKILENQLRAALQRWVAAPEARIEAGQQHPKDTGQAALKRKEEDHTHINAG